MRRAADAVMTSLASLLTHVFFRHVEIEGLDGLPRDGPTVLLANHTNGLVDALLLMTTLRRFPRFLGKATLFRIAPLRPFLRLAGAVPIYRPADGGGTAGNEDSFRMCRELLARGGVIALFPEGISHNEPALQPLRTGAARIALGAAADDATPAVVTVAVGLVYDARARFRSRALVRVGRPCPVDPWVDRYRTDARGAVREMTESLAEQLHEVVTTYRSWQEAGMLAGIADLVAAPSGMVTIEDSGWADPAALADRERIAAALAKVDLDATPAGRDLGAAYETYQRDLALIGLSDAQVTAHYGRRYQLAVAWSIVKILAVLPPGMLGVVIHAVPYQAIKRVATRPANESIKATVKLLGCAASFALTYVGLAEVVRRKKGLAAGAITLVAAPLSGYAALRLGERIRSVGGLLEGARIVRSRQVVLRGVLAHRADVIRLAGILFFGSLERDLMTPGGTP